jgi:hypothetical protein
MLEDFDLCRRPVRWRVDCPSRPRRANDAFRACLEQMVPTLSEIEAAHMLGLFPQLGQDEFFFSAVARLGIAFGEPGDIPLMRLVFGNASNRKNIDLPTGLGAKPIKFLEA